MEHFIVNFPQYERIIGMCSARSLILLDVFKLYFVFRAYTKSRVETLISFLMFQL
jgi:hypothetical protein